MPSKVLFASARLPQLGKEYSLTYKFRKALEESQNLVKLLT